jgi:hypothetical protein
MEEMMRTTISFNNVGFFGYLLVFDCFVLELLLAGLVGEGRRRLHD